MMSGKAMLSFDVEEFDLPREHGGEISVTEGAKVSAEGLKKILEMLERNKVRATFFCTGNFAKEQPELVLKICEGGHELAGHGVDHFAPEPTDAEECKKILKKVAKVEVVGYRQPRMQKINYADLRKWGYKYDSSVNPAFIPGRYNNTSVPRRPFVREGVVEIPTSVATGARVPLFWLALHLFPLEMYVGLAKMSVKRTGYLATYFHPWEFANLARFGMAPKYIKHNSGDKLVLRLEKVIWRMKKAGCEFVSYGEFCEEFLREAGRGDGQS